LKAALLLCATAACTSFYDPCFLPASLVTDLRVLAVSADPPEVLYDPVTFAAPAVRVRALAVDPGSPDDTTQVSVRACVPTSDARCPDTQPWDATKTGTDTAPAEIPLQISPEQIRAALAADPLAGYGGVRIQVEVQARTDRASTTASKLLVFNPAAPGYEPNHGFLVTGLATADGAAYPDGFALTLPVAETVGLRPLLAPAPGMSEAAETYEVTDLAGHKVLLRERISYSFFTLAHAQYGPLGHPVAGSDVADEPGPGDPQPEGGLVRLTALSAAIGRIWVVARDGRGAEEWASIPVLMPDNRGCSVLHRCPTLDFGCQ
jgi:hypothetical protein